MTELHDIRLIALDCDGTIFSKHGRLSEYAASVLAKLKARGIMIVICSGRPFYSIKRAIRPEYYDYAVCMNGQSIFASDGMMIMTKRDLSSDEISEITRLVEKHRVMMSCSYNDDFHHFTSKKHHFYVSSVQRLKNVARRILGRKLWSDDLHSDYEKLSSLEIAKICFSGMPKELKKLEACIDPERYSIQYTSSMWVEVQPPGVSKGEGLREIQKLSGIDKAECLAMGDGENDLSMFQACGIGTAMKNAMPALKEAAQYVTAEHCIDDGAAKWLDAYILQNRGENPLL